MKKVIYLTIIVLTVGLLPILINPGMLGINDFTSQQVPFILETKRMLGSGAPFWSWNTFAGANFWGSYSFYTLTSPFVWIACLFPASKILWGILLSLYLKTICASVFSYLYFKKMSFNSFYSTCGALLYTFSSFWACNLFYFHFCEPILIFPIFLIALEKVIRKESNCYIWLSIASFAVVFINFYFAVSTFLLGLLYLIFRTVGNKTFSFRTILLSFAAVILGILIDAFILLPTYYTLEGTARATIDSDSVVAYGSIGKGLITIIRIFVHRLPSLVIPSVTEMNINDSMFNYSAYSSCQAFINIFGIFGIIIYCKQKRNWLSWLLLLLVIIYLTPLNNIFSLFTNIGYTRWLYGFIFLGIVATLYVLKDKTKIRPCLFYSYIVLVLLIFGATWGRAIFFSHFLQGENIKLVFPRVLWLGLFILNMACLFIWYYNRNNKTLLLALISLVGCAQLSASTYLLKADIRDGHLLSQSQSIERSQGRFILSENLDGHAKTMKYRTDNIHSPFNIEILNNMPGIYSQHSVFNKELIPLRKTVNSGIDIPKFMIDESDHIAMNALMSVKEVRDYKIKSDSINFFNINDSSLHCIKRGEQYDIYSSDYFIEPGFAYTSYMLRSDLDSILDNDINSSAPKILLDNVIISESDESVFKTFMNRGIYNSDKSLGDIIKDRRKIKATNFSGNTKGYRAEITTPDSVLLFFSVAADPGFTAFIDSIPTKIYNVNLGMNGIIVPPGSHQIVFKYFPPGLKDGIIISFISVVILIILICFGKKRNKGIKISRESSE